jgi:hypothetical protein
VQVAPSLMVSSLSAAWLRLVMALCFHSPPKASKSDIKAQPIVRIERLYTG